MAKTRESCRLKKISVPPSGKEPPRRAGAGFCFCPIFWTTRFVYIIKINKFNKLFRQLNFTVFVKYNLGQGGL
jgi:hypothetical protein